jgi:RND family efflux transporter MFP subunit
MLQQSAFKKEPRPAHLSETAFPISLDTSMTALTRNWRYLVIAGALLLAGGGVWLLAGRVGGGSSAPEEAPPNAPVKWMEARQFFIEEWTEMIGTTQPLPDRAARITTPVEGQVVSVLDGGKGKPLIEGQPVKKGAVIVQLNDSVARANRNKAAAAHEEVKQHTKQAEVALKLANLNLKALAELSPNSALEKLPLVTRFDLEKAQLAFQDADSKLKAAEFHELTSKSELDVLEEQLKLYALSAPIDGRLGRLLVVQGQTLAPGTLVADIINVEERIDVVCFVPAYLVKRLKTQQLARIGGVDNPQQGSAATADGKIEFIADQAEADTGNVAVKVRFPNKELGLRANTTIQLRVLTNTGKACLTLPEAALFEDQDPPAVMVVENYKVITKDGKEIETGTARKLQVKLGIRDRALRLVEIFGLHDPENQWHGSLEEAKFVIERGRGLRTGDPVQLLVED